ncbi:cytochrome P450 [Chaetomium fimeti]|uniref:Cytochrome P450 n=1 Tax=Chaetomium fimeti TaxID=1854472 RepID=A0AAE0H9A7_9PEZI|nr:cytochrome P450 [Chaetomium fimeti]
MVQILSVSSVACLAVTALSAVIGYFVLRLSAKRRFYRGHDIPKAPHDPLWGHLKLLGEYTKKVPGSYVQALWTQMKLDFNLPDIFYLDLWPFGPEFIVCASPDAAAMLTTVNAFPQADLVAEFFAPTIGSSFIEATNGALWKELHQMLAPGLTPGATRTYHDLIVDEAKSLHDRVRRVAASGETTDMTYQVGQYPFSIMWTIFFGERPDPNSGLYDALKRLNDISGSTGLPLNPITRWQEKRERAAIIRRLDKEIEKVIHSRFAKVSSQKPLPTRANASCLLDRMFLDQVKAGLPLDNRLIRLAQENAEGFLVAGYSTTTDTSSYVLMLLYSFPEVLQKVREEHDRVFGKDFDETLRILREDPGSINDLPYTTAVIQETLRMFPIGMVVRDPPPGMTSFEYKGTTYPVGPNHSFTVLAHAMHHDATVFASPKTFQPERFLPTTTTYPSNPSNPSEPSFPRSGYRPFERGLRSCMGQALAMTEMKVALVVLARGFDMELCGHNPVEVPRLGHTDLDMVLGDHAFQDSRFTAGPNGEVEMKVRVAVGRG